MEQALDDQARRRLRTIFDRGAEEASAALSKWLGQPATLTTSDMQGARMTLTNVGSFGNLLAAPIIPVGQIGILGPGLVERRPLAAADGIRLGYQCMLTLMFDRRALDDLAAHRFMSSVCDHLDRLAPATSPSSTSSA